MKRGLLHALFLAACAGASYAGAAVTVRAALVSVRGFPPGEWLRFVLLSHHFAFFAASVLALLAAGGALSPKRRAVLAGICSAAVLLWAGAAVLTDAHAARVERTGRFTLQPGPSDAPAGGSALPTTNGLGFRGRALRPARSEGVRRVALIGDSYVWGQGVPDPETLDVLLERELGGPKEGWEAGNFGIPSFNFHSDVRMLASVGPEFRPDIVVIGLNEDNDLIAPDWWEHFDSYGRCLWSAAALFGLETPVFAAEIRRTMGGFKGELAPAQKERMERDLDVLAGLQRRLGIRVILFSYGGPLRWMTGAGARGFEVCWPAPGWTQDPTLVVSADDPHPTGRANLLFARQLAKTIRPEPGT